MIERNGKTRLAAALLSTVAMVLSCPEYDIWWLGLVQWIPWFWAIEGATPRRAFLFAWITGFATVSWGFSWMSVLLTKFAGLPLPAALPVAGLFAAWHGCLWGLAAWLTALIRRRTGWSLLWVAPMCWVAVEAVLPCLFPIYMALSWCWQPLWIQVAELGGVTMVSGLMVAINAALYQVLNTWLSERRLDRRAAVLSAVLLVGTPAYGAVRIAAVQKQMDAAPKLKFAVVQGNMSILEMRRRNRRLGILTKQQQETARLQAQGAQIALWGETAYPNSRAFRRDAKSDLPDNAAWKVQRFFDIPVLFGAVTRPRKGEGKYPFNTAILLDGNGQVAGMYDKVYRLAFGEYAPLVDPKWYLEKFPNAAHIAQGSGASVLELEGKWRLGPFICYEDILPRFVREAAQQRVHVFVNLTNDAWFGLTDEPTQHLGLAVFRTVEHRKGLVRSVNTGVSAYVDPTGRLVHRTQATDPDAQGPQAVDGFLAEVPMMDPDGFTLYGTTGEGFNGLMVFGVLLAGLWRRRERDDEVTSPPLDADETSSPQP
ncbi:MAG: apolipoprotein N-acyltransferase [Nannocystaceae bacterium]|nr:apolipoprotein N-acyltransferase [Nannocystaceae bacterium]